VGNIDDATIGLAVGYLVGVIVCFTSGLVEDSFVGLFEGFVVDAVKGE
jgi:hypothetical protein